MYEKTSVNNFQYTEWFQLHILLNFIYQNIVFRCTIPLGAINICNYKSSVKGKNFGSN